MNKFMGIKKIINIDEFVQNYNEIHKEHYISQYVVARDENDEPALYIPIPVEGEDEAINLIKISCVEDIYYSIETVMQ